MLNNLKKKILEQIASEMLQNRNMLNIKINNHFYNYYLTLLTLKLINLSKLHQKKHINRFALLSLTAKSIVKFNNKNNHPDITKTLPNTLQKKESLPSHIN